MVSHLDSPGDIVLLAAFTGDGAIIAACLTGLAAILTAWAALVRAKRSGNRQCQEELAAAHRESEALESKLHHIRMNHPEVMEGEDVWEELQRAKTEVEESQKREEEQKRRRRRFS